MDAAAGGAALVPVELTLEILQVGEGGTVARWVTVHGISLPVHASGTGPCADEERASEGLPSHAGVPGPTPRDPVRHRLRATPGRPGPVPATDVRLSLHEPVLSHELIRDWLLVMIIMPFACLQRLYQDPL